MIINFRQALNDRMRDLRRKDRFGVLTEGEINEFCFLLYYYRHLIDKDFKEETVD